MLEPIKGYSTREFLILLFSSLLSYKTRADSSRVSREHPCVIPDTHTKQPLSWSTSDRNRRLSPVDVKPTHYSLSAESFLLSQLSKETKRDEEKNGSRNSRNVLDDRDYRSDHVVLIEDYLDELKIDRLEECVDVYK